MYTHFNQHDASITDAQDALLQRRMPGKLGNLRLGDILQIERDKDGNPIDAPPGRIQQYLAEPTHTKGDIWTPALSPDAGLAESTESILQYSLAHPALTLAFDETHKRFRIAYLGPIQRNTKPINPKKITHDTLPKLRFFGGNAYIIREKDEK